MNQINYCFEPLNHGESDEKSTFSSSLFLRFYIRLIFLFAISCKGNGPLISLQIQIFSPESIASKAIFYTRPGF